MRRTPSARRTFARTKDYLAVSSKSRVARLLGPPEFPRPTVATLDLQGLLRWKWYPHFRSHGRTIEESDAKQHPPKLQRPRSNLCFEFARLAFASDEQIRAFAERWGPLGIEDRAEERVSDWRDYAALAAGLLRFAAELGSGGRGSDADWLVICNGTAAKEIDRSRMSVGQQRAVTGLAVNTWFAKARGHRILDLVDAQLQMRPGASNLLGVLITQIAHIMIRSDERAVCAGCKGTFPIKKRLSRGSRQYCSACRKAKVPQRDASRDWRRRAASKTAESIGCRRKQ